VWFWNGIAYTVGAALGVALLYFFGNWVWGA
jgi:hypothetical protein